jgi:excisionase family DNA binding protein
MNEIDKTQADDGTILLTPSAAARELGRSEGSIRAYAATGKLPCLFTTTGRRLFKKSDVDAFVRKLSQKKVNE